MNPSTDHHEAPPGRRSGNWIAAIIAVVVLVSTAFAFYVLRRPATRDLEAVAVLPFVNRTGDRGSDPLAERMTESLVADLARIPTLRVVPYRDVAKPRPAIAAELGVDGVIAGSLLRAGDRVVVEVQVLDGVHDRVLWSEQFERDTAELARLQRDVARVVGAHLRGPLARDRAATSSSVP